MKSLVYGCAAAAFLCGLAAQAQAEIRVQDAPVHAVPAEDEDGAVGPQVAAAKAPPESAEIAKAEPAAVKALIAPKVAQEAALTPDETAFFAILGARVTDAASAYETYVRRTVAIDPAFTGSGSVQKAVKASTAYHPVQLEEGIVAYAALVALRNPAFVEGVRAMDPRFADGLAAQPGRVMQVRGSYEAAADVAGVLRAQGESLTAAGKAITKAAYDIQAQAWSKSPVSDPQTVLADAKASAEAPRAATIPAKEKLLASLVTAPQGQSAQGQVYQGLGAPDVVRGLALAALAITGHTGDGREAEYEALLHDASSADCLKMAKMNLNQCLAVAGPQYEDVYCSGRHAVSDTGKCVSAAASGGPVVDAPAPAPAPRIETADIGREQAAAYGRPTASAEADDDDAITDRSAQIARPAPAQPQYRPQPAPQTYARNDYPPQQAQPQYQQPQYNPPQYQPDYQPPQAQYAQPQYQQQYQQPQYQQPQYSQPQAYQPYAQPPQYPQQPYQAPQYQQPYRQPQPPNAYAGQPQQPYYPQQGYPQQQSYYGR